MKNETWAHALLAEVCRLNREVEEFEDETGDLDLKFARVALANARTALSHYLAKKEASR